MEPQEPTPPRSGGDADDALRRLEDRLGRASEAAERLIAEAADAARSSEARSSAARSSADTAKPPPAGWQVPSEEPERRSDIELLMQVVNSVRDLIPPELQRRLAEALRELLLAVRALIDWYLERTEQRRQRPSEVQDIPIL